MLVGLAGFAVGACELVEGELRLWVESVTDGVGCSGCGTRAAGHGRSETLVRGLPVADRPQAVV
jgi:Zn ribbon nucleic-acid-binding protein